MLAWDPETKEVLILDWKTGRSDAFSYRWQMRLLGLAAAKLHGAIRARVVVVRVGETEVDDSWEEYLDEIDFEEIATEAKRVVAEVESGRARPGNWCEGQYCKARAKCAAYRTWRAA